MFIKIRKLPIRYVDEYKEQQLRFFRGRLKTMSITVLGLFMLTLTLAYILRMNVSHTNLIVSGFILALVCAAVVEATRRISDLISARLIGFLFCAGILFVLIYGPSSAGRTLNYGQFILSLFFITLFLPWSLRDVFVLIIFHFIAWFIYYSSEDLTETPLPETLFGPDPLINGTIHLFFSAVICLIIRFTNRQRDIDNFLLLKDLQDRRVKMDHEIRIASKLHQTLVPKSMTSSRAEIAVTYRPATALGGDYARYYFQDKDYLIFFVGDITGHGVPAALMVNRLHVEFLDLVQEERSPGVMLSRLNDFILKDFEDTSMYLSAVCGALDFKKKKMIYSNYGHPPQYLFRKKTEILKMEPQASLLGVKPNNGAVYEAEVPFSKGDSVLLFTDGILELKNPEGVQFGRERLERFLLKHGSLAPIEFNALFTEDLNVFSGKEYRDDILILNIRVY